MSPEEYTGPVVGAPLEQPREKALPMLTGVEADSIVEVFNPLSAGFRVQFARSMVGTAPETPEQRQERIRMAQMGLSINKVQDSTVHSIGHIVLPPGVVTKLPGNIAQIAVRRLVTYIIQQRGKPGMVANEDLRAEVEKEVVHKVTSSTLEYLAAQDFAQEELKKISELNNEEAKLASNDTERADGYLETAGNSPSEATTRRKPGPKPRTTQ